MPSPAYLSPFRAACYTPPALKTALALLLALSSFALGADRIDFVIDIDGIILFEGTPAALKGAPAHRIVRTDYGYAYRIAEGAPEFLQSLATIPGAHLTFYSGGSVGRNEDVLKKFRLPNGKSAREVAFRVLSDVDRTVPDRTELERWAEAFRTFFHGDLKKDLRKVPGLDPSRAFFFDDRRAYVAPGQERNFVCLDYEHVSPGYEKESYPLDASDRVRALEKHSAWDASAAAARNMAHRNKLVYGRGLVQQALDLAEREKISPVDALWKLQWQETMGRDLKVRHIHPWSREVYALGLSLFRKENPGYTFVRTYVPASSDLYPPHCREMLTFEAF